MTDIKNIIISCKILLKKCLNIFDCCSSDQYINSDIPIINVDKLTNGKKYNVQCVNIFYDNRYNNILLLFMFKDNNNTLIDYSQFICTINFNFINSIVKNEIKTNLYGVNKGLPSTINIDNMIICIKKLLYLNFYKLTINTNNLSSTQPDIPIIDIYKNNIKHNNIILDKIISTYIKLYNYKPIVDPLTTSTDNELTESQIPCQEVDTKTNSDRYLDLPNPPEINTKKNKNISMDHKHYEIQKWVLV